MGVTYSDGEFVIDDPELEQVLLQSAAEWGVSIDDALWRILSEFGETRSKRQG